MSRNPNLVLAHVRNLVSLSTCKYKRRLPPLIWTSTHKIEFEIKYSSTYSSIQVIEQVISLPSSLGATTMSRFKHWSRHSHPILFKISWNPNHMWRKKNHKEVYHFVFSHYSASPSKGESSTTTIQLSFISISWLIPKLGFDLVKPQFPAYFPFLPYARNRYKVAIFITDFIYKDESTPLWCAKSSKDQGEFYHNLDIFGALSRIRFEFAYICQIQACVSFLHL